MKDTCEGGGQRMDNTVACGKDHLSLLAEDCLYDIFSRVDHNDLDEISTLNSKMTKISNFSRTRAVKIPVTKIFVWQTNERELLLCMLYKHRTYILKATNGSCGLFKEICTEQKIEREFRFAGRLLKELKESALIRSKLVNNRVLVDPAILLNRFHFGCVEFGTVAIDHYFLEFLVQIVRPNSCDAEYYFEKVSKENLSSNATERFLSMIIASKANYLRLLFQEKHDFIDESFLTNYANAAIFPRLHITLGRIDYLRADQQFASSLSKYGSLNMPRLLFNTDWLIPTERLRRKISGDWQFEVTRIWDRTEIEEAFGAQLQEFRIFETDVTGFIELDDGISMKFTFSNWISYWYSPPKTGLQFYATFYDDDEDSLLEPVFYESDSSDD